MLLRKIVVSLAVLFVFPAALTASDWPQFRGPNASGISPETHVGKDWNQRPPKMIWKTQMTDNGYAGPSVAGGRVFIIDHNDKEDVVRAIDLKTGKDVWEYRYPDAEKDNWGFSRATPVVDKNRVFALSRMGTLNCLDAKTGKKLWSRDTLEEFKGKKPGFNYAMSPLVDGNKLILCPGGPDASVIALDKTSGRTLWQGGGTREPGYSTPVAASVGGKKEYVALMTTGLVAVDAATGAEAWTSQPLKPFGAPIPQPIVQGDAVFLTTNGGSAVVDVAAGAAKSRWVNNDVRSHISSPVLANGYLYMDTDPGDLVCVDWQTGAEKWRKGGFEKGPLSMVDGVILIFDGKEGDLIMVQPNPDAYKELGRFKPLGGQSWNAPVIAGGKLIVRNKTTLACFDLK